MIRRAGVSTSQSLRLANARLGNSLHHARALSMARPKTAISAPSIRQSPLVGSQLQFNRAFHTTPLLKYLSEADAPGKVRLLKTTRKLLVAMLISYGIILTTLAAAVTAIYSWLEYYQPLPLFSWGFSETYHVREALLYELYLEDYTEAKKIYGKVIESLTRDSQGNLKDISDKSSTWLAGYSDLLCRYADMAKVNGDLEACKEAYIGALAIPFGSMAHKSKALTALAEMADMDGDHKVAEGLLLRACAYGKDTVIHDPSVLSYRVGLTTEDMVPGSRESLDAAIQLGVHYAANRDFKKALPVLVSSLRAVKNSLRQQRGAVKTRPLEANPLQAKLHESSLISVYISEVLWATGKREEAVTWAEKAYNEGYIYHRSNIEAAKSARLALSTLIDMEKALDHQDTVAKYSDLLQKIEIPARNVTSLDWFKSAMF